VNHYFNVEAAPGRKVIYAYCGDDRYCSLPERLPAKEKAMASTRLPSGMRRNDIEVFLEQTFTMLAAANPGNRIIVRFSEDNTITAWLLPLRKTRPPARSKK
jgi:hypothetical protein